MGGGGGEDIEGVEGGLDERYAICLVEGKATSMLRGGNARCSSMSRVDGYEDQRRRGMLFVFWDYQVVKVTANNR